MAEKKSLEELGLTHEQMFSPEAMEFWKQFPPEEFLINFLYDAMTPATLLEGYLGLLDKYIDLESFKIDDNHDAKWVHETLLGITHRIIDSFKIIYYYHRYLKDQNKADTDHPV